MAATMGRKRRGVDVHGWLVIDKPLGMTSAQAVGKVRRILNANKAGHAGTLDPLATGILPIALGEATKTVSYVMDGAKTYRFKVRWGEARTTDDAEGEVSGRSDLRPERQDIEAALGEFLGVISQVPPAFSAIRVAGRRAYELARAAQPVKLAPRQVRIDSITLTSVPDGDHAEFEVCCGKGTYVRGLARDLGERLGCLGHVVALRRTRTGPFDEKNAISVDKLASLGHSAPPQEYLLPVATGLDDIPALALTEAQAEYLRHGRPVRIESGQTGIGRSGKILCAMSGGYPVALARLEGDDLRPVRVLNL